MLWGLVTTADEKRHSHAEFRHNIINDNDCLNLRGFKTTGISHAYKTHTTKIFSTTNNGNTGENTRQIAKCAWDNRLLSKFECPANISVLPMKSRQTPRKTIVLDLVRNALIIEI